MACVGEKLEEREAGKTMEVVNAQMEAIGGEIFLAVVCGRLCAPSST